MLLQIGILLQYFGDSVLFLAEHDQILTELVQILNEDA